MASPVPNTDRRWPLQPYIDEISTPGAKGYVGSWAMDEAIKALKIIQSESNLLPIDEFIRDYEREDTVGYLESLSEHIRKNGVNEVRLLLNFLKNGWTGLPLMFHGQYARTPTNKASLATGARRTAMLQWARREEKIYEDFRVPLFDMREKWEIFWDLIPERDIEDIEENYIGVELDWTLSKSTIKRLGRSSDFFVAITGIDDFLPN